MQIKLTAMPITTFGIYGSKKDGLPERARYLHPDAARAFLQANAAYKLRVSDMLRSAESSLAAMQAGRGAKPPGFSGHNYGLSVDLDVDWMLRRGGAFKDKEHLDEFMNANGWFCHRGDHKLEFECWHYNYFPFKYDQSGKSSASTLEAQIIDLYGPGFKLDAAGAQAALKKLGMYSGAIDGKFGTLSREALRAFARAWNLPEQDVIGQATARTLAFVAAEQVLV